MSREPLHHARRLPAQISDVCHRCDGPVWRGDLVDVWVDADQLSAVTHVACAPSDGLDGPHCPRCLRRMHVPKVGWNRSFTKPRFGAPRCLRCEVVPAKAGV